MILDPWRQLATKMVREGLLSAHESEDCFSPKTSSDKSDNFPVNDRASEAQNVEMNSVDNIKAI